MESEVAVDEVEAVEVGVVVAGVGAVAEAGADGAVRGIKRGVLESSWIAGFLVFDHVMPMSFALPIERRGFCLAYQYACQVDSMLGMSNDVMPDQRRQAGTMCDRKIWSSPCPCPSHILDMLGERGLNSGSGQKVSRGRLPWRNRA